MTEPRHPIPRTMREKLFVALCEVSSALLETAGESVRISVFPGESDGGASTISRIRVLETLRGLEGLLPLERDLDSGVHETLVVDVMPSAGRCYLAVENALAARETVTVQSLRPQEAYRLEAWSVCRESQTHDDTAWDAARAERRVVIDPSGYASAIDRGANAICDLLNGAGLVTRHSCEGHPEGAYVSFDGDLPAEVGRVFSIHGWEVLSSGDSTAAYMPKIGDVVARDDAWREICAGLEPVLAPRTAPVVAPGGR